MLMLVAEQFASIVSGIFYSQSAFILQMLYKLSCYCLSVGCKAKSKSPTFSATKWWKHGFPLYQGREFIHTNWQIGWEPFYTPDLLGAKVKMHLSDYKMVFVQTVKCIFLNLMFCSECSPIPETQPSALPRTPQTISQSTKHGLTHLWVGKLCAIFIEHNCVIRVVVE